MLPNFKLLSKQYISNQFLLKGIHNFHDAINYVKKLPYGKNLQNKIHNVLEEEKGNKATKNALLVQLAHENGFPEITLALGFYEMNDKNAPILKEEFKDKNIDNLPNAANYILYKDERFDCSGLCDLIDIPYDKIQNELVILPSQISDFVSHFHRFYMINWIKEKNLNNKINIDQLWNIKNLCEDKILDSFAKINKQLIIKNSLLKMTVN